MSMTLSPRHLALGAVLALALAAPALAAAPNAATPAGQPAGQPSGQPAGQPSGQPSAQPSGQPPGPGSVTATTPSNGASAQGAQTGDNDHETADEGPGQHHHGNGPDHEGTDSD